MRIRGALLASLAAALLLGGTATYAAKGSGGNNNSLSGGAILGPSSGPTLLRADTITYDTDT